MPIPVLTQAQIAQLTVERDQQASVAQTLTDQVPAKTARQAELVLADSAFKSFFDYFNDDIIGNYDQERRALDGIFIISPVIEQDIVNAANITGRLTPTPPATTIVRIPEFDGGGTGLDPLNETQHLLNVESGANVLQNGYGTGTATGGLTSTILLPGSNTLSVTNTVAETISPGDFYVVEDGVDLAVIEVLTVTDGGGTDPPFLTDLTISVIAPPSISVGVGGSFVVFNGFSDADRIAKVSSNASLQPLMDFLIQDLEDELNLRVAALDVQDTAIGGNGDDDGVVELAAALISNGIANTFIQNYLISTDVSNIGLGTLGAEKTTRDLEILGRVGEITSAYTSQTLNYYDERFTHADNRGNLLRGTLRQSVLVGDSLTTSVDYAASAGDAVASIDSILP